MSMPSSNASVATTASSSPDASRASISRAEERSSADSRSSVTAAAVIAFPITIPPSGMIVRGVASRIPIARASPTVAATESPSARTRIANAPGTSRARFRAVTAPRTTMAPSRSTAQPGLPVSKISWIATPSAVSCTKARSTATPISRSRPTRCQNDSATATAARSSASRTWASPTSTPRISGPPSGRRAACRPGCSAPPRARPPSRRGARPATGRA